MKHGWLMADLTYYGRCVLRNRYRANMRLSSSVLLIMKFSIRRSVWSKVWIYAKNVNFFKSFEFRILMTCDYCHPDAHFGWPLVYGCLFRSANPRSRDETTSKVNGVQYPFAITLLPQSLTRNEPVNTEECDQHIVLKQILSVFSPHDMHRLSSQSCLHTIISHTINTDAMVMGH